MMTKLTVVGMVLVYMMTHCHDGFSMTCPLQFKVHSSHMRLKLRMLEQVVENT